MCVLSIGLLFDTIVFLNVSIITVSFDYINHIFGALVTVAAISATILTLVINSFSDKYFGFSIKEIANFKNSYLKISNIIPISLISIILATILLALGMTNTLVAVLISIILLISSSSHYSWKLISDNVFCEDIVLKHIENTMNDKGEIINHLIRLYKDLELSVENHGLLYIDKYVNLILKILNNAELSDSLMVMNDEKIKNIFIKVSKSVGYLPAIDKILQLYNLMDSEFDYYDRRELLLTPIQSIQYLDDWELASSSMVEIPKGLKNIKILNKSEKIMILYNYFSNVYSNEIITNRLKQNLINKIISQLTYYSHDEKDEYSSIQQETLLYIVKNFVLTNQKVDEAELLTIKISESFYSAIVFADNKTFYETISLIYAMFYMYSKFETETIKQEHRKKIEALISVSQDNIHTNDISYQKLIFDNFEEIVKSLWNIPDDAYRNLSFLDYFPPIFGAKSIVWDKTLMVKFAIYNYLIIFYNFNFPPYLIISDWENREDHKFYIRTFLNFFNPETKKIKDREIENLNALSKWIGKEYTLSKNIQKDMFEKLKEDMQEIVETEVRKLKTLEADVTKINSLLSRKLTEENFYGYNEFLPLDEAKLMHFRPAIIDLEFVNDEVFIISKIIRYFERLINDEIKSSYSGFLVSFDLKGVRRLLDKLKTEDFKRRNYTYINDLALDNKTRSTEEFRELEKIINSIKNLSIKPINSNMFFNDGFIEYNIKIISYNHESLTSEEISNFVEGFKVSDQLYKIGEGYFNKSKAMEIMVCQHFFKQIL